MSGSLGASSIGRTSIAGNAGGGFVDLACILDGSSVLAASLSFDGREEDGLSLRRVRARIAHIIEGTPPTIRERQMAARFKHQPQCGDNDPPTDSRGFYLVADTFGVKGPYTPGNTSNRRSDTLRIVVVYADDLEDGLLQEIMSSDYDAITGRLLNTTLWSTAVSDIIALSEGGTPLLPATITNPRQGAKALTITIPLEHLK